MNSIYTAIFHSDSETECSKRFTIQYYPRQTQTWYQSETFLTSWEPYSLAAN